MFDQTATVGSVGDLSPLAELRARLNAPLALEAGLLDDYRRLVGEQRRLAARELDLLAEIDAAHAAVQVAGHTTSGFVAEVSGCTAGVARRRVRHSERLTQPRWAPLADAFGSGRVGAAHVEVLLNTANPRIEDAVTTLLPELLDLAGVATFTRFTREVRGIAHRLDTDGGYDPNVDPDSNRLRMSTGPDGALHLEVDLVGELALMVRAVIDAATEAVRDRYRADHKATVAPDGTGGLPIPSLSRCAAEGLADVLQRGAGVPDDDEVLLHPDAIVILHPAQDGDGVEDLLDAEITDIVGNPLPRRLTSYIVAAGNMWPIEFSNDGDPLRAGTKVRFATPQQRRALAVRDGGCVFPGCTRNPEQTDAHHVEWWHEHDSRCPPDCELEGPTNIENLALLGGAPIGGTSPCDRGAWRRSRHDLLRDNRTYPRGPLCRHHHRVTHRPGWTMQPRPDVAVICFTWTTPTGDTIHSQRHGISTAPAVLESGTGEAVQQQVPQARRGGVGVE